ncbi:ferrochelatase [Aliikangiella sp. IMCC44359]|uniref:ferrochelatase n=1 Tax=Aliikangiella sp. IMCC44359 TaxID=3459125 RepID=UPI00403B1833
MKYTGNSNFSHKQQSKIGVLLTNLGTPSAATKKALRVYLKEFLSDPRVVEVPRLIWWFVLNLVILNIRPKRSASTYQKIWTERGSPLQFHSKDQADKIRTQLQQHYGQNIVVEYAMRYGQPAISDVINKMMSQGVNKLLVLPLYPQYSGATGGSTFDAIADNFIKRRFLPEFRFINHYHDYSPYIDAVAQKIKRYWSQNGRADKLIFSYHGIPKRYLLNGDPYHCECYKTSRLIAQKLNLKSNDYLTTFQSRFGREEWLKPYTDHTLKALPGQGVKSVQIVCPGFSSDCLETIEEIRIENRDYFIKAGGEKYQYIEALNSDKLHIEALVKLVHQNLTGWDVNYNDTGLRAKLATRAGAKA